MIEGTCDVTPPPVRDMSAGHQIACHLSVEILEAMEPVIQLGAATAPEPDVETV
jgi:peptide/nickel transport system ATP-binding protein